MLWFFPSAAFVTRNRNYISDIILNVHRRALRIFSSTGTRKLGHIPSADNATVAIEKSITRLVSGMASRLVMRKYFGKLPKTHHTSGAVNIWQEMLSAAASQILRIISPPPADGYHEHRFGNISTIPAIARYDSQKLTELTDAGFKAS